MGSIMAARRAGRPMRRDRAEEWEISQVRFVDDIRSAIKTDSGYPMKLADSDKSLIGLGATYDVNDTTPYFLDSMKVLPLLLEVQIPNKLTIWKGV